MPARDQARSPRRGRPRRRARARVTPSHGRVASPSIADGLAPDRPLGVDPLDRGARPAARPPPRRRRAGRARAAARPRARGRSRRTRRRGRAAAARGRIRGAPSRTAARCRCRAPRGSAASQRSTAAPASGRPAASSPVTPNRRRIARSWPIVVEARARAPHAPASASARVDQPVERPPVGGHRRATPRSTSRHARQSGGAWPGRAAPAEVAPSVDDARQPVAGEEAAIGGDRIVRGEADAAIADALGARARSPRGRPRRRAGSRPR